MSTTKVEPGILTGADWLEFFAVATVQGAASLRRHFEIHSPARGAPKGRT